MGMDVPVNASDEDLFHIGMELVNEIDAGSDGRCLAPDMIGRHEQLPQKLQITVIHVASHREGCKEDITAEMHKKDCATCRYE